MAASPFEYEKKPSPFARIGLGVGLVAAIATGVMVVRQLTSGEKAARRPEQVMVAIKPLPPPPPPPPPPQNVPKQQVEEQTQVSEQDMKPAEEAPQDPTPSLGTGITGNGPPDGFGIGGKDRGFIGGTGAGGGGSGSRFGGYFTQVVQAVTDALGRHPATRNASFDIRVRVWSDATGRVSKVRLLQSTGEPALDRAIRTEALLGCRLPDLPADMRMPLELRLNLRRPR